MNQYISPSIQLPAAVTNKRFSRADLVFLGVDAREDSFIARAFLDAPDASPDTSPQRRDGYAGFFAIFGHGGCYGDEGHCDFRADPRDAFDQRPPHGLTPQTKLVDITSQLQAYDGDAVVVTVLPVVPSHDGAQLGDVLSFAAMQLVVYSTADFGVDATRAPSGPVS